MEKGILTVTIGGVEQCHLWFPICNSVLQSASGYYVDAFYYADWLQLLLGLKSFVGVVMEIGHTQACLSAVVCRIPGLYKKKWPDMFWSVLEQNC